MASKELFEVEFTKYSLTELKEIYHYISNNLCANKSAKRLVKKIKNIILNLSKSPYMYEKIKTSTKLKREYRRIVVDSFLILYTIDEKYRKVYISHIYYSRRNYI